MLLSLWNVGRYFVIIIYLCAKITKIGVTPSIFMKPRQIEEFFRTPFTRDRIARIGFGLLIFAALVWLIVRISYFLIPLIIAWLMAYLMLPLLHFLEDKCKIRKRWLSTTIVLLVTIGLVVGLLAILIPSITNEVSKGWEMLKRYDIGAYLLSLLPEELSSRSQLIQKLEELMGSINMQELFGSIEQIFTKGWGLIESTFNLIAGGAVIYIFLFYLVFLMLDYEKIQKGFMEMMPVSIRPFMKELGEVTGHYANAYFRSQALIAMICGVVMAVGFYIIGLPMGITLGLLIGLLNMIPYMQTLGYLPLVILVGLQSVMTGDNFFILLLAGVGVIVLSDVLQQVLLTPLIQGQSLGIHPVAIMLSLTVWGSLFGFFGMLFALPLTMICYHFYMKYVVGTPVPLSGGKGKMPDFHFGHKAKEAE